MIPVRIPADAPLHTVGGLRTIAPEHPMSQDDCPVCDVPLTVMPITLVYVGIDPETRAQVLEKGKAYATGAAVAVHAACAGLDADGNPPAPAPAPAPAMTWTSPDGVVYDLTRRHFDRTGGVWTCIAWFHPMPGSNHAAAPIPLLESNGVECELIDELIRIAGPLTAAELIVAMPAAPKAATDA